MKNLIKYLVLYIPLIGILIVMFKEDFLYIRDKYGNHSSTLSDPIVFFTSAIIQGILTYLILDLLWVK